MDEVRKSIFDNLSQIQTFPFEEKKVTQECYLPVMDHRNKTKQVPDILDINNTLMRCLVKNLALFGLGLHIYAGEDMPFGMPTHASEVDPETGEIKETTKVPVASSQSKAGSNGTSSTFAAAIARVGKLQAAEMSNAKRMAPMLFQGAELERYQEALAAREKELASPVAATAATSAAPSGLPI